MAPKNPGDVPMGETCMSTLPRHKTVHLMCHLKPWWYHVQLMPKRCNTKFKTTYLVLSYTPTLRQMYIDVIGGGIGK